MFVCCLDPFIYIGLLIFIVWCTNSCSYCCCCFLFFLLCSVCLGSLPFQRSRLFVNKMCENVCRCKILLKRILVIFICAFERTRNQHNTTQTITYKAYGFITYNLIGLFLCLGETENARLEESSMNKIYRHSTVLRIQIN